MEEKRTPTLQLIRTKEIITHVMKIIGTQKGHKFR